MSRWRPTGHRSPGDEAATQAAPAPTSVRREVDDSWPAPLAPGPAPADTAGGHRPRDEQPAVAELGEELLRQADVQRRDPAPMVEFDHDEIEAILRRATQLGSRTHTRVAELDSATLADIAAQVGIPASAVAAAVAERRVGIDSEISILDRLIGPDQVWTERHSVEAAAEVNERVIEWLERGHGLRPRMTDDGVVVATRRSGLAGSLVRSVRSAQGKGGLGKVREVRGTSVSIDADADASRADAAPGRDRQNPGRSGGGAVALVADLADRRNSAMVGGGVVTALGTLTVGTVALVVSPVTLVALPVVAGAGLLTSRLAYRPTMHRVRNELDYTVDQIARGKEAPTLFGDLATPITERLRRR